MVTDTPTSSRHVFYLDHALWEAHASPLLVLSAPLTGFGRTWRAVLSAPQHALRPAPAIGRRDLIVFRVDGPLVTLAWIDPATALHLCPVRPVCLQPVNRLRYCLTHASMESGSAKSH